ncbi:SCO family protein [Pedobacter faecalis]|uniref:SCO family protein n=1 Tax=Pedobacter faecalis TaxID=3041495 RepID=UPI002550C386|nr:SCO family protein [Pedobacter sp. ELA7]
MNNKTSLKKVLILVTILAVPGFLYYILQDQGKNRYRPLPRFHPVKIGGSFHSERGKLIPDTIFHKVGDFKFLNQKGDTLSWANYGGDITVFNLFYTWGHTDGLKAVNGVVQMLNKAYERNPRIRFVSLSIDPAADRPDRLRIYADSLNAMPGKWNLVTGDSAQVFKFINEQLFVDAATAYGRGGKQFSYGNMLVLVDPNRQIRGYYEAYNHEAVARLNDEIKVLLAEVLRNTKDGR